MVEESEGSLVHGRIVRFCEVNDKERNRKVDELDCYAVGSNSCNLENLKCAFAHAGFRLSIVGMSSKRSGGRLRSLSPQNVRTDRTQVFGQEGMILPAVCLKSLVVVTRDLSAREYGKG